MGIAVRILWTYIAVSGLYTVSASGKEVFPLRQDKSGVPLLKDWVEKVEQLEGGSRPDHRIMFIESWSETGPVLMKFAAKAFNKLSMMKLINQEELDFVVSINGIGREFKNTESKKKEFLENIATALRLSLVVEKSAEQWRVLNAKSGATLFKSKPPAKSDDEANAFRWLSKVLGFHGVVLDVQGNYVLVAASRGIFNQPDLNSLILRDSKNKVIIKPSDRQGLGLLKLERFGGKYGIFSALLIVEEIPVGSKVLIEVKSEKDGPDEKLLGRSKEGSVGTKVKAETKDSAFEAVEDSDPENEIPDTSTE